MDPEERQKYIDAYRKVINPIDVAAGAAGSNVIGGLIDLGKALTPLGARETAENLVAGISGQEKELKEIRKAQGIPEQGLVKSGEEQAQKAVSETPIGQAIQGYQESVEGSPILKGAQIAGDIGGSLAGVAIPGGAPLKALGLIGKGTKVGSALTKAGEFLGGSGQIGKAGSLLSRAITGAARGAGVATEQAAPSFIMQGEKTGDWKNSLLNTGLGIGLGGLTGGVLGSVFGRKGDTAFKLEQAQKNLDEQAIRDVLGDQGVRAWKTYIKNLSPRQKMLQGDDLKREFVQYINEKGVRGGKMAEADFDKLVQDNIKDWDKIEKAFNEAKPSDWSDQFNQKIARNTDIQAALSSLDPDTAQKVESEIFGVVNRVKDPFAMKQQLRRYANVNRQNVDAVAGIKADMAQDLIKELDDDIMTIGATKAGLDLAKVKKDYKMLIPFQNAEAREAGMLGEAAQKGSDTQIRTAIQKALSQGGATAGVSAASDAAKGQDFDPGKTLLAGVGGSLLGPILSKVLVSGQNRLTQAGSRLIGKDLSKIIPATEEAMTNQSAIAASKVPYLEGQKEKKEVESTPEKEAVKEKTKAWMNEKYFGKVQAGLANLYAKKYANSMTYEDFISQVEKMTNNFEPRRMAKVIFPDKTTRKKYLSDLDKAERLSKLDVKKALKKSDLFKDLLGDKEEMEAKAERENLRNLLAEYYTSAGNLPSKSLEKQIEERISFLAGLPEARKRAELERLLQSTGQIDFEKLRDVGVV